MGTPRADGPGNAGLTVVELGPEKGENPRRGAAAEEVNHRVRGTHRFAEQGLEVDGRADGSRLAGECARRNGMGAGDGDEPPPAADRENPLDG